MDELVKIEGVSDLTKAEQQQVAELAAQIDVHDTTAVSLYGTKCQKKMTEFSDKALEGVRSREMGDTGALLAQAAVELKSLDEPEGGKGLFGIFQRGKKKAELYRANFSTVEKNVDDICDTLEGHRRQLLRDADMLDDMYAANLDYYRQLTLYITAGKQKLEEVRSVELPALAARADQTRSDADIRAVSDLRDLTERFERRLYDLELTRTVSMQMAPQIRLLQSNDVQMAEKIQSLTVNTVPLWKSQMTIALGLEHAQAAANAQRVVTDLTNELLRSNAEKLKTASVDTARELERGVIDIETLQATNAALISTIDEVSRIHAEGAEKRAEGERQLAAMEEDLKQKLLEASGRSPDARLSGETGRAWAASRDA